MKKVILLAACALLLSTNALAHQAFTLVSSEKKALRETDLVRLENAQTIGKKDKTTLTFTEKEVRLVVITGPEDDMLSYRIQGMRSPTIVVPADVKLTILFINSDLDMRHDVRFGHVVGELPLAPETGNTAGSTKLVPRGDDGVLQAEELVLRASSTGAFKYFCSVRGHAKGGMWGNIAVGAAPGNLIQPTKKKHEHAEDEDHVKPPATRSTEIISGDKTSETPAPTTHHDMRSMNRSSDMEMSSTVSIADPMSREASGTSWAPDSSPVFAKMKMTRDGGMLMLMGTAFLRYTRVGSTRDISAAGEGGRSRVDAPSMFMAMYSRPVGENSQIGFRAMASLDPVIQKGYGYPLLYQSGELYRGQPIHDRQHPHDLISELAVTFSHKFDEKRSIYLYAGLPGEPALGPPMYLHRASGANNPDAPVGHHWQDATHIAYGVVTGGLSFGKAKIEASAFNGREPNENRWNFDPPRLSSFSGRVSVNPTKNLAFQISHGYLRDPEPHEPSIRILRKTTASAIYNKKLSDEKNFAGSFVWGQNYANGERSNSLLMEGNYDFYKNAVFTRFETVKKNGHDLVLDHPLEDEQFWVNAFSLGYVRDLIQNKGVDVGLGTMFNINHNPGPLAPVYGGTTHGGWQVFLLLRPSKLTH